MPTCPRCTDATLQPRTVHGVDLHACPACNGVMISMRDTVRLMDAVSAEFIDEMEPDQEIEAIEDDGGAADCPSCGRAMQTFGYMGTRLVFFDRCSPCEVLWMDPKELAVASELYARTNRRTQLRRQATEERAQATSQRFDAIKRSRKIERMIVGGMARMI